MKVPTHPADVFKDDNSGSIGITRGASMQRVIGETDKGREILLLSLLVQSHRRAAPGEALPPSIEDTCSIRIAQFPEGQAGETNEYGELGQIASTYLKTLVMDLAALVAVAERSGILVTTAPVKETQG